MRIAVLGCGAIGGVIAGHLARAGREVVGVDPWFDQVERIRRDGLYVQTLEETFVAEFEALHLDELDQLGEVDLAVFATKAYDTNWIVRLAEPYVSSSATVLSAQNGMNEAALVDVFGVARTIGCVVPFSAAMWERGHVHKTSASEWGSLILGEMDNTISDRVRRVAEALSPLSGVSVTDTVQGALWGKMTLNVMGNVLAGLTGYTTRALWTDPAGLDVMVALAHEIALLAESLGVTPDPVLKTIDHDLLLSARTLGSTPWEEVKRRIAAVGRSRLGKSENVPSLGQDIRKGRRTEVGYLNGWVVRHAALAGLPAALNAAVTDAGRQLEIGALSSDPANIEPLHALVTELYGATSGKPAVW
jgi:2-dehydropantoate 2-reductase